MSEDLTELLARVESASGPDRELDALLWCLAEGAEYERPSTQRETFLYRIGDIYHRCNDYPAYTASLDDALALVERVLPGWDIQLTLLATLGPQDNRTPRNRVVLLSNSEDALIDGEGATPALALLAALLKALTQPKDPR